MRRLALAGIAALSLGACRPYDNYTPLARQGGLVSAEQFARYGREPVTVRHQAQHRREAPHGYWIGGARPA